MQSAVSFDVTNASESWLYWGRKIPNGVTVAMGVKSWSAAPVLTRLFSPSVIVADLDRCFGINGEPQGVSIRIGGLVHAIHFGKNRLGFSNHLLRLSLSH